MNEKFEHLMVRAEQLITRIESILPQPMAAPDWTAAVAWRYRKRSSGHGALEPVRHIGVMQLESLKEIDLQKEKIWRNTLQFVCLLYPSDAAEDTTCVDLGGFRQLK